MQGPVFHRFEDLEFQDQTKFEKKCVSFVNSYLKKKPADPFMWCLVGFIVVFLYQRNENIKNWEQGNRMVNNANIFIIANCQIIENMHKNHLLLQGPLSLDCQSNYAGKLHKNIPIFT